MKAENKATRRIRNTKGASYLTHGGDDYDHKGLNNARRSHGKAIIRSWMEESHDDEPQPVRDETETTFRVVLTTQVYENYGTHCCECETEESCTCKPYWKAKGGSEYQRAIGTASDVIALGSKGVQAIADEMAAKVARDDNYWQEYAIGWNVVPSTEETYDEQMYREMRDEGYWPDAHKDEIYAQRMASLILS
jgi:hypothetical protein